MLEIQVFQQLAGCQKGAKDKWITFENVSHVPLILKDILPYKQVCLVSVCFIVNRMSIASF